MAEECPYCDSEYDSESRLHTHLSLNHREEAAEDGIDIEFEVSDGYLEKQDVEKGEQFGYDKRR